MKKLQKILILLVFILMLTACAKEDDDDDDRERKPREEAVEKVEDNEKFVEIDKKRYEAYLDALEDIIEDNEWPEGGQVMEGSFRIEDNRFAICDIDMDGKDELIVDISSASMAGMIMQIYDYDAKEDELVSQGVFFPAVDFYDNGVVCEYASHNQGPTDFWPYAFSWFNSKENTYVAEGSVYAEDKEYMGDSFPADKDADGDGRIYYISEGDSKEKASTEAEYKEWQDSYIKDANTIYIPWKNMWIHTVEALEELIEIKGAVVPISLGYNEDITNYDVTGDGVADQIHITCNQLAEYEMWDLYGSDWVIEINGKKIHDFEWEDEITLEVELYQISDKRQYLLVTESYEYNDDIGGYALYQVKDGKLVQVCDFYDTYVSSMNEFHYGATVMYMTKDEMMVRAHNQFNATASLSYDMFYTYKKDAWQIEGDEFGIYYDLDYQNDKADGMTANQSFGVYTKTDCKKEAFKVEKGDVLKIHSIRFENGATYFKVTNEDGVEGWFPDPEEPYTEINGEYLNGYFEEAMFAG